jgi:uncharacterized protein YebE (UPF0316 family)
MIDHIFSEAFRDTTLFNWVVLPLFIYVSRASDVTLATLRNLFISKGIRNIVPVLGFFEVLIWLIAVTSIVKNLNNVLCYLSFAAGYSTGIFIGISIERKLALGKQVLRIITNQNTAQLVEAMKEANIGLTIVDGHGAKGPVKILFSTVPRKEVVILEKLVQENLPDAFYTIEDAREVSRGVFPDRDTSGFSFSRMILPGMFTNRP